MNTKPIHRCRVLPIVLLLVALTILACDVASLIPGGSPKVEPTQPPLAQATQPPLAGQPSPAVKPLSPAPPTAGGRKIVSPDELNSYRMKMTFRSKSEPQAGESVWTIAAVKNPPAKHTVMGNIEVITIGDKTWTKIAGKWIQQPPSPSQQASAGGLSDDLMKQLEEKYTLQEVGRETVNGVSCKRYTYKGEVTVPAQAGFQGEITVRAQGEAWVADQAGLPPVGIRQRGDLEMQSNVAPGSTRPTAMTMTFSFEIELYDINAPITITPPGGAIVAPPGPTIPGAKPSPAIKPSPTTKPGAVTKPTAPATVPAAGAQVFADEFSSATLNAKWKWEDRWQDAKYDLKARSGFLRITAPTGNDLAPWTNFDAPYLVQPVDGNWIVETSVECAPVQEYQGAGILVYQDDDNLVRLERGFGGAGGGENGVIFAVIRDGEFETIVSAAQAPTIAKKVELRLQREGNRFTAWWREPGKTWQNIGSAEVKFPATVQVGVAALAEFDAPDLVADFDYFRISRPR